MTLRELRLAARAIAGHSEGVRDPAQRALLQRFAEQHQAWWQHENVVGVCVARPRRGGVLAKRLALQVLVRRKLAAPALAREHRVPSVLKHRAFSNELPTDVRAVGAVRLDSLISAARPARPGFDIGNQLGGSGTLGCIVLDASGRRLGLSCAHVLAPDGSSDLAPPSNVVWCPSPSNAETLDVAGQARLGALLRVITPSFSPDAAATNLDVAVFVPDQPDALDARIADLGVAPSGISNNVKKGLAVRKVGAVSGETHGTVQTPELSVKVPYGDQIATFCGQIGISSFTQPGDSGALVLDEDNRAVGIHFASMQGMSICMPIGRVLDALECRIA